MFGERLRLPRPPHGVVRCCRPRASSGARERCGTLTLEASGSYRGVVRAVGLKILKNKLSEYVRLAARGETVLVTDRDQVVAELGPPRGGRSPIVADARLAELVRRGLLTPAVLPPEGSAPRKPVVALAQLLGDLARDRSDR